jgi:subtilisin family serine protease
VYEHVLRGFSVKLSAEAVDALRGDPAVRSVRQVEEGAGRVDDHTYQTSAPWGLDRVDQRNLPLNATYGYSETGSGVRIYTIDSGIRTGHAQFGGRASVGFDARPQDGQNGQDCLGHGTHVAGIAAGQTYGIAKAATLVSVRVTTACTGSVDPDDFIAGVNWVAGNHVKPAVANASIGFVPAIDEVDQAVSDAIVLGVPFAVSGGNNGLDACGQSPAKVATAITTGATTSTDARWTSPNGSSNVGSCLDLFAPGANILSAWHTSNTATQTLSGTSMAAPHVTGTVAGFLQFRTTATPSEVAATIVLRATSGVLTNIGTGSPNLLLHSRFNDLSISGPSSMNCIDMYTWVATASGVGSSFAYIWQQGFPTGFGGGMFWQNVGTGPSYSRQGCPGDPYLWLRVTATDEFGFHRRVNKTVTVAP